MSKVFAPADDITAWVSAVAAHPDVRSIWLAGSRAEGTARPDSDWDVIVYLDSKVTKEQCSKEFLQHALTGYLSGIDVYFLMVHGLMRIDFNPETKKVSRVFLTGTEGLLHQKKKRLY